MMLLKNALMQRNNPIKQQNAKSTTMKLLPARNEMIANYAQRETKVMNVEKNWNAQNLLKKRKDGQHLTGLLV